jgi:hypothetical protein
MLPFSRLWASNKPLNAPFMGLFEHWLVSVIIMLAPPPGDAYNFILKYVIKHKDIIGCDLTLPPVLYHIRWPSSMSSLLELSSTSTYTHFLVAQMARSGILQYVPLFRWPFSSSCPISILWLHPSCHLLMGRMCTNTSRTSCIALSALEFSLQEPYIGFSGLLFSQNWENMSW